MRVNFGSLRKTSRSLQRENIKHSNGVQLGFIVLLSSNQKRVNLLCTVGNTILRSIFSLQFFSMFYSVTPWHGRYLFIVTKSLPEQLTFSIYLSCNDHLP